MVYRKKNVVCMKVKKLKRRKKRKIELYTCTHWGID